MELRKGLQTALMGRLWFAWHVGQTDGAGHGTGDEEGGVAAGRVHYLPPWLSIWDLDNEISAK